MRDTDDIRPAEPLTMAPFAWLFASVLAAALIVAFALGATLGTFFGGLAMVVIVAPWAAMSQDRIGRQWLAMACVTDAVALTWLVLVLRESGLGVVQWLEGYCLLLSAGAALWAIASGARRLRISNTSAAAVSAAIGIAWLSAPIWLLHHLQTPERLSWMQRIIAVHPLFATNSIWPLGVWTESPLAYRMMNLNQDVYYELPDGPWLSIASHAAVALAVLIWIKAISPRNRAN